VGAITSGCPSGLCLGAPHRIEMTARLIRDGYIPGYANAALSRPRADAGGGRRHRPT
jgi:hypothetical protein